MLLLVYESVVALWKAAGAAQEACAGFAPRNTGFWAARFYSSTLDAWISECAMT
jgi:hypothetical protein